MFNVDSIPFFLDFSFLFMFLFRFMQNSQTQTGLSYTVTSDSFTLDRFTHTS